MPSINTPNSSLLSFTSGSDHNSGDGGGSSSRSVVSFLSKVTSHYSYYDYDRVDDAMEEGGNNGHGGGDGESGGDWCTAAAKKVNKKQKKKQRPVPLRDFFCDPSESSASSSTVQTELIRTSFRTSSPSSTISLTPEEEMVAISLRTYFADLLKRLGPVRADHAKLKEEVDNLEALGRHVIARYDSLAFFLSHSDEVRLVDNYLCTAADVGKAKALAIETIVNNAGSIAAAAAKGVIGSGGGGGGNNNPWNRQMPPPVSSSPARVSSPSSAAVGTKTVDVSLPPPPIQKPPSSMLNSFFSSPSMQSQPPPPSPLSGFGGIGTVSNLPTTSLGLIPQLTEGQQQAMVESLSKRLQGLAKCNSELLLQLQEKEKQICRLNQTVADLEEKCERLKASPASAPAKKDMVTTVGVPLTESQLIIQLQKQLESERLNAQSLKQQLDIERMYSSRLAEKQTLSSFANNGHHSSLAALANGSRSSSINDDSLGLRGLLSGMPSLSMGSSLGSIRPSLSGTNSISSLFMPMSPTSSDSMFASSSSTSPELLAGETPAKKILEVIHLQYPGVTEPELERHLKQLRNLHGRLSGMPLQKVVVLVKSLIERERLKSVVGMST